MSDATGAEEITIDGAVWVRSSGVVIRECHISGDVEVDGRNGCVERVTIESNRRSGQVRAVGDVVELPYTLPQDYTLDEGVTDGAYEETFREQAAALAEGGVDLFAVETMMFPQEATAAIRANRTRPFRRSLPSTTT